MEPSCKCAWDLSEEEAQSRLDNVIAANNGTISLDQLMESASREEQCDCSGHEPNVTNERIKEMQDKLEAIKARNPDIFVTNDTEKGNNCCDCRSPRRKRFSCGNLI